MKRLAILTVGKTHSGKTTFARELERCLPESVVIDRDDLAEFINTRYESLLPKQGANTLKDALTRTLVDYAVHESEHLFVINDSDEVPGTIQKIVQIAGGKSI
ncbi:hypothetical protein [Paenibacillus sp. FSL P2-0136]|uniref:hypothetical protein n=1 Tax=Paenibacillus sp. FSL P2-0136 TaxID=2975317 RepID=UPI0030DA9BE0